MRYLDLFHKRIFLYKVINQQQGEYALLNMTTKYWENKISFFSRRLKKFGNYVCRPSYNGNNDR